MNTDPTDTRRRLTSHISLNENGCWIWTASRRGGYGTIWTGEISRNGKPVMSLAHRVSYELYIGEIPTATEIDHLCRNRLCVNPNRLEAVSHRTNALRGTGAAAKCAAMKCCKRGHPKTPENTAPQRNGHNRCRLCKNMRDRLYRVGLRVSQSRGQ